MDADRFDALLRALLTSPTRRGAFRLLLGPGLAGVFGPGGESAAARKGGKKKKKKRKPECARDADCLGNDHCCGGVCLQCCQDEHCLGFNETCCPSGNCKRPDEECCGPGGACPQGKHCCGTGICRECCGKQHCPEENSICCTVGFCTRTDPFEQCCTDADCAGELGRCCTFPNGATGCRECCEDQHCATGERCDWAYRCYPCLPAGAYCADGPDDGFCCSYNCEPFSEETFFGRCAG